MTLPHIEPGGSSVLGTTSDGGQGRKILWVVGAVSVAIAALFVFGRGSLILPGALLAFALVVGLTLYRIDWGFYFFVFASLVFDQYPVPGFDSLTTRVWYHGTINANPYLRVGGIGILTLAEVHILFLIGVWVLRMAIFRGYEWVSVSLKPAVLAFAGSLVFGVLYGVASGADIKAAIWEVRALFSLLILIFVVPQIIRTKSQLQSFIWVCIAAIVLKALQAGWRLAMNGFSFSNYPEFFDTFSGHEDPVFMNTLIILLCGFIAYGVRSDQRKVLTWSLFPIMIGFYAANRRAAYVALVVSLFSFFVLLPQETRRRMLGKIVIFSALFSIYLVVFWNSPSGLGKVAWQVKSTVLSDPDATGYRNYSSDLYRRHENYNLAITFRKAPLQGIGFGKAFDRPINLWISFGLSDILPHNQIIWVAIKTGALGFFCFSFLIATYVLYMTRLFSALGDPYLKAICAMALIAVINQWVVSFVDMQLAWPRNMIYLGFLMSLSTIIPAVSAVNPNGSNARR
jgi:hypothetical protein